MNTRHVLNDGRRVSGRRMVLCLAPGTGTAVVVAGRRVGGAVERNRARRILRAAWSEVAPRVQEDIDIVVVARQGILGAKAPSLVPELLALARKAGVMRP